jgi:hypothetical protein
MEQAVLSLAGVVLGAAIAGGVALWQVQLVTNREREVRRTERELSREDVRDAFQREAILAMQDAMADLNRAVGREQERMLEASKASGKWPARKPSQPLLEYRETRWAIARFRSRIFDESLRDLADAFRDKAFDVICAPTEEAMWEAFDEQRELGRQLNQRITALLPKLF